MISTVYIKHALRLSFFFKFYFLSLIEINWENLNRSYLRILSLKQIAIYSENSKSEAE